MSSIAAVWMLLATPRPAARWAAEVELEPIEPGEWAAWAKAQPTRPTASTVADGTGVVFRDPAADYILPRGRALRLRP